MRATSTKYALFVLCSVTSFSGADEIAWGDVGPDGSLENRALDVPIASARGADNFFISDPMDSHDWTHVSVVRNSLFSEIKVASARKAKVEAVEEALRPIYTALPKDSEGRLKNGTARYALHRLFSERQGWSIKGMQPAGAAWLASQAVTPDVKDIIKYMVPTYLQDSVLHYSGASSFDLRALAVLAVTIEHLVHAEMTSIVYSAYTTWELPIPGKRTEQEVNDLLDTFMMVYSFGVNLDVSNRGDVQNARSYLEKSHAGWPKLRAFSQEVKRSTFTNSELDFDEILKVVEKIGEKYVEFQGSDCSRLRDELSKKPSYNKGAVKFSEVSPSLASGRRELLTESKEDLQKLGAIREAEGAEAQLIIPNYINSQSMCLSTASFYAACCVNECEGLLAKLEREFRAPAAKPEALAQFVRGLPGANMQETADLTTLADPSSGLVALHSRAFATWMHSAFPLKCSAPDVTHTQKVTNPKTADEWIEDSGLEVPELEEMMKEIAAVLANFTAMGKNNGSWVNEEETSDADKDIIRIRPEEQEAILPIGRSDGLPTLFRILAVGSLLVVGVATAHQSLSATRDPTAAKKRIQEVDYKDFA